VAFKVQSSHHSPQFSVSHAQMTFKI